MGRRKIDIEKIENKNIRNVTFTKRRQGLFKKAVAARDKYGLRIAILVFSPAGKPYTFGDSSVIDQFLQSSSSLLNPTHVPPHLNSSVEEEENVDFEREKKRSRDGDDLQVILMEKAETKRRKMITTSTTEEEDEEEVKQGFLREDSQNFNSDEIEEELKNYDEGFNKQIVNEQRLVVELLEEEEDFESKGNKDSSSEILVEGDDYCWPSNEELNQLIDDNNGTVDADHNMFSLPSLDPPPNLSNDSTSSYMNTANREDEATWLSTLDEWFY